MVKIPTYEAKQGYSGYSMEGPKVDLGVGKALENLGETIGAGAGKIADVFARIDQRNKEKAAYDAELGVQTLAEHGKQAQIEAERNAPADGTGIAANTLKAYDAKVGEFTSTLSPELKEKIMPKLTLQRLQLSNNASNAEYDHGNKYSTDTINQSSANAQAEIIAHPEEFDRIYKDIQDQIDAAPNLTDAQRKAARLKWDEVGKVAHGEGIKRADPKVFTCMVGNCTSQQRYSIVAERTWPLIQQVLPALIHQESGGKSGAVSPKNAIGLMQVWYPTAIQIANELGDTTFLGMSKQAREAYLKRPDISMWYGTHYLGKQLETFGGDINKALAAYNAGPGRVTSAMRQAAAAGKPDAWLEYMPAETRNYVPAIRAKMGNEKFLDAAQATTPTLVTGSGEPTKDSMVVVQGSDGKFATVSNIVDGKTMSTEDMTSLYNSGTVPALGTYDTKEEADKAADPSTPSIGVDDRVAADEKPFYAPVFNGVSPTTMERWQREGAAAAKDLTMAEQQAQEAAKTDVQNLIDKDVATMATDGKGTVAPTEVTKFEASILATQGKEGKVKLDKWRHDRAIAGQKYEATKNLWVSSNEQIAEQMRQLTAAGTETPDQKDVIDFYIQKSKEVADLRKNDPGEAALKVPQVYKVWEDLKANPDNTLEDRTNFLGTTEYWQRRLGFYSQTTPRLLPNSTVYPMVDQLKSVLSDPTADMAAETNKTLDRYRQHYGSYGDQIFKQVQADSYDSSISADTRLVVSSTMSDWQQRYATDTAGGHVSYQEFYDTQGRPPPGYRAAEIAAEMAAADRAAKEADRVAKENTHWWQAITGPLHQSQQQFGQATADELNSMFGYIFGANDKPVDTTSRPSPKEQKVPAPDNGPPSDVMDANGKAVPQSAIDHVIKTYPSKAVERDFRDQFGDKAWGEAEKRGKEARKKEAPKPTTTPTPAPDTGPGVEEYNPP